MAFAITPEHIAYRKKIATVDGLPLYEVMTTGGLFMNILGKNGQFEIVGTGSHRAISRFITKKKVGENKIKWEELSKSEDTFMPPELFGDGVLEKYEELTDRFRSLQGVE